MSNARINFLNWVEISRAALTHNIRALRNHIGKKVFLAPCIKANAYGHGLLEGARLAITAGADWLCLNAVFEAESLRKAGIRAPLYIMGYVADKELESAVALGCRMVMYNRESVAALARVCKKLRKKARVHLKIETGTHRQGIYPADLVAFVKYARQFPEIEVEGIATHFANIEDTRDPFYATMQLKNFKEAIAELALAGIRIPLAHCANSAATLLSPETHFSMVRPGIAVYGLWPSEEVKARLVHTKKSLTFKPVLSWRTRIAQVKEVSKGGAIGYGCTYKTRRKTRIAILPVGYYDGYDRGLSNKGSVLIHGKRAPVRGRICMNIMMVDVTDIPHAKREDPVTLIGKDGGEYVSADFMAELAGTINYEITTRIREGIPRVITV